MRVNYTTGIPGWKVACIVLLLLMTGSVQAQSDAQSGKTDTGINVGLAFPVSTRGVNATASTNNFSFHLLFGVSKNETAFAFAGFSNIVFGNAKGVMLAGFSNHVGGKASGEQLAGFMNVLNESEGLQLAGFLNRSKNAKGIQLAGFSNLSSGGGGELQVAGFANISKDVHTQVGGFANIGKDVNTQVAGFINVARKVKGVQIGVINISESNSTPIGLINIVKNGEMAVRVSVDEMGTVIGGFESGSKQLYGFLGVGYNGKLNKTLYALEGAIGGRFQVSDYFRINAEVASTALDDFKKGFFFRSSLRVFPSFRIGNRLEIFGGPTINYAYFDLASGKGMDLVNHFMWSEKSGDENYQGIYLGAMGGISLKLR